MNRRQRGFTLIEIIIAFSILTMGTVLTMNVVTQSSIRTVKVNEYMNAMDTLESAVATLRSEISRQEIKETYQGGYNDGYTWAAKLIGEVNPQSDASKKYMNLYRIRIQVFHDTDTPRIELVTVIADS